MLAAAGQHSGAAYDQTKLDANKAIARRVFEDGFNHRNLTALRELYNPNAVDDGAWTQQKPGPAGMPLTSDEFRDTFPEVLATVDGTIAEDDLVTARVTWHGAHPSAGPYLAGRTMHVFQIDNGLIVAQWSAGWDWLTPYTCKTAAQRANPLVVASPAG